MLELAVVYLAAAIIAVLVTKRLGLGSVLGYLLAGILIGPFLLYLGNSSRRPLSISYVEILSIN